jgi:hypothetical protein
VALTIGLLGKNSTDLIKTDNKWFIRSVEASAIIESLASLHLKYPDVGPDKLKELAAARAALVK